MGQRSDPQQDDESGSASAEQAGQGTAAGPSAARDTVLEAHALVGTRIGNIRVDELLAIGGMGAVYAAFDEVLQRPVAVKAVRDTRRVDPQTRARFLREARLLSKLEHRNICQIYDYIQGEDTDFLILELIRGSNLRNALRAGIPITDKTRIAAQLLDALIAAHDQGVVHRDLKPDNVMLSRLGEVKVLDFGIARVAGRAPSGADEPGSISGSGQAEEDTAGGIYTRLGAVVGTLEYMSPEQAVGEEATPASDIYSCGLVLQELFTGSRAFEEGLTRTALLSRAMEAQTRPIVGLDPELTALIERMKSPAPGARPSARDAADRLAWIRDRPRRRARRLVAGLAVAALGFVAALMSYQAWRIGQEAERANRAAARASREAEAAAEVSEFLEGLFRVSDPGEARGNSIRAREILDRGAARIRSELVDQPETRARLLLTMGRVYRELGLYQEADQLLGEALESCRVQSGADGLDVAAVLVHTGRLRELQGRFEEGAQVIEQALQIRTAVLGIENRPVADALVRLANIHYQQGRYDEAIAGYVRALEIFRVHTPDDPVELFRPLHNLANVYQRQGRFAEAIPLYQESLRLMEEGLGADHSQLGHPLNNLGMAYSRQGREEEAIPLFERALAVWTKTLGAEHHLTTHPLNNLAEAHRKLGRLDQAVPLYLKVLEIRERILGPDHPDVALTLHGLAQAYAAQGRHDEALPLFARALEIRQATLEPDHPDLVQLRQDFAAALRWVGRETEASRLEAGG